MVEIHYGDNLEVLKNIRDEFIDLVYMDPPFNSKVDYKAVFNNQQASTVVFTDIWKYDESSRIALAELSEKMPILPSMANSIGESSLLSYLLMMIPRLIQTRRILKPSGSVWIHCDTAASHYLKIIMDSLFGLKNFRGEIVWKRATSVQKGNQYGSRKPGKNHDILLYYSKNHELVLYNPPRRQLTDDEILEKFNKQDERGRYHDNAPLYCGPRMKSSPSLCYEWNGFKNPHSSGWRMSKSTLQHEYEIGNVVITEKNGKRKISRRVYQDDYDGVNLGDLWTDINPIAPKERRGYPTQKPVELLKRIIKISSNPGNIVLDPFCGGGTTALVAEKLGRKAITADMSVIAVSMTATRFADSFDKRPKIIGLPNTADEAILLAEKDKNAFSEYARSLISNAVPDGDYHIGELVSGNFIVMAIQNCSISDVEKLTSLMNDKYIFGIIVCISADTDSINRVNSAGMIKSKLQNLEYDKMQIQTIKQLLEGNQPNLPIIKIRHNEELADKPELSKQSKLF